MKSNLDCLPLWTWCCKYTKSYRCCCLKGQVQVWSGSHLYHQYYFQYILQILFNPKPLRLTESDLFTETDSMGRIWLLLSHKQGLKTQFNQSHTCQILLSVSFENAFKSLSSSEGVSTILFFLFGNASCHLNFLDHRLAVYCMLTLLTLSDTTLGTLDS